MKLEASLLLLLCLTPICLGDPLTYTFTSVPLGMAEGINNSGAMVGWEYGGAVVAALWANGTLTTLTPPGAFESQAYGISNSGQVVGEYMFNVPEFQPHGFLYSGGSAGTYTTIDVPDALWTIASGINTRGQIVGTFATANGASHGFLYQNGTFTTIDVPGSVFTNVSAINDLGEIVGQFGYQTNIGYGFLYSNGSYTIFEQVPGLTAINNLGHFAGDGQVNINGAFIPVGQPPGFVDPVIGGINDSDQLGVSALTAFRTWDGFLATPVPEPASFLLCAFGLAFAFTILKRAKLRRDSDIQ